MNIFRREVGGGKPPKPLQLVQRGTDTRIPIELVAQPSGEVLDLSRFERLSVKIFNDAGTYSTPPTDIQDNHLIVEVTADISQALGTGVYSVEITGRVPDTAFTDGYHDYTVRTTLCRVTSDGSDASPTKVTANVIEILKGKDGMNNYQLAVKHGYQGTEEQFAKDIIPKSNYERAKELQGFEGTEEDYLDSLHGAPGKDLYQAAVDRGYKGSFDDFLEKQKGAPGESIYDIAVRNGFVGSEQAYLASLKGEKGKDAYQSYLATTTDNPKLTEAEWADTIGSLATLIHTITYGTEQQ
jgi:PHIKZ145